MEYSKIQRVTLTKNQYLEAIRHAKREKFLDNLRDRNEFVAFDSKVRGYIGEIYLTTLFNQNGITILNIDHEKEGYETDIDIEVAKRDGGLFLVECKTSLVPDIYKTIEGCIKNCDIKIIRREKHYTGIPTDIQIQIYFDELRKVRDSYLESINGHVSDYTDEQLFELLKIDDVRGFFVAWIDRDSLNTYLGSLPMYDRIWKFGYRTFWRCPLSISRNPDELVPFLKQ